LSLSAPNFARLNHVLIPSRKSGRDRLRERWYWRIAIEPIARTYYALSQEGRALFLFTAIAGFAALDVERSQTHVLWALLLALLIGSLAVKKLFALTGVRIGVEGPARVVAGESARFQIALENRGDRVHHGIRVARPFLPWDGAWTAVGDAIACLAPGERRCVGVSARFSARGQHHLDAFSASALVPLRLVLAPRLLSAGTRFTVVPPIAGVRTLRLPVSPRYQPGGVALASVTGESMELVGVRPYRAGDRIRDLHAKTWARTGEPAVREYHQEYFSRVGVVLDTDRTHASEEQLEAGISLAAGIVARLSRGEALIDLLVTGDRLHPLTLGRSLGFLEQALDHLACVEPGPRFDARVLVELLRPHLGRLSSVVFVSLKWDEARSALAREIRETGVGCRSITVSGGEPGGSGDGERPLPEGASVLAVGDIRGACEGGRDLAL
jgi:uncharacterized protein (DUF58 family)